MVNVIVADDHKILRDGLRSLIEKEPGMSVIAEADNGRKVVRLAQKHAPHVVIMDITMPDMNGIEATRKIKSVAPLTKIIALSMHSDRRFVLGMLEAGASGYLLKDCAFDDLVKAIRQVMDGNTYLSPRVSDVVVKEYIQRANHVVVATGSVLTPREREITQLIAEGMSVKVIATHLNVSIKTVESHRRNVMEKLETKSIAELTKYAVREGLVSIEG